MKFHDLREFIATTEKMGELQVGEGVNRDIELGAITELAANREEIPAVLFDSIEGFP